jgi:outer membrane protein
MGKAIEESNEGKALQDKFKSTFEATRVKMDQKGAELEKRVTDFNRNQNSIPESEREKTMASLEKEISDFEKETEAESQKFRASVEEAMNPLYDRAEAIVMELARTQNYLAVVENGSANAIIYAEPSISVVDITPEVIKALNGKR